MVSLMLSCLFWIFRMPELWFRCFQSLLLYQVRIFEALGSLSSPTASEYTKRLALWNIDSEPCMHENVPGYARRFAVDCRSQRHIGAELRMRNFRIMDDYHERVFAANFPVLHCTYARTFGEFVGKGFWYTYTYEKVDILGLCSALLCRWNLVFLGIVSCTK